MTSPGLGTPLPLGGALLTDPFWYYSNWSAYDILSDEVDLSEEIAMRQLDALVRLRASGVRLDYYMMDAGWWAPDGGYRTWRTDLWEAGPDRWIAECLAHGIKPGLWFACNSRLNLDVAPAWQDSVAIDESGQPGSMSFSEGGFLADFMDVLQYWYDREIRMFKLDFADFDVVAGVTREAAPDPEVRERNKTALREALADFRLRNPEAVLLAYNGFLDFPGHVEGMNDYEVLHAASPVDLRWLEVFSSLYTADSHPSGTPMGNLWRSMDHFSDKHARRYEQKSVPLERIDNAGFMCGDTNTSIRRGIAAWKGMLLLSAARGGWVTTIYGNLELLDDDAARWFARVQEIYLGLHAAGRTKMFGGAIDGLEPYGFASFDATGSIYTVVNPTDDILDVALPRLSRVQAELAGGAVVFRDAGYVPVVGGSTVTLGPGQLAAIGFGEYAEGKYDLGVQEDVVIPREIRKLDAEFRSGPDGAIEATVAAPATGGLRVILRQRDPDGAPLLAGSPDGGRHRQLGDLMRIEIQQDGRAIPLRTEHDRFVWSGLSWTAAEAGSADLEPGTAVSIRCASVQQTPFTLHAEVSVVEY